MGNNTVIPDAYLPNPTGQTNPNTLTNTQANAQPSKTQLMVAARDSYIPVLYGGPERLAGKLYIARIHPTTGALVLCLLMCEGQIQGYCDANGVYSQQPIPDLNDVSLAYASGTYPTINYTVPDSQSSATIGVTYYTGTQGQTLDPTLAACIPGFTETQPGTAYVVITVPKGLSSGFPRFTFLCNGLLVHEPRWWARLKWSGTNSLIPEFGPNPNSLTRALSAYFRDFEEKQTLVPANCARFTGTRFVQNLLVNSNLSGTPGVGQLPTSWTYTGSDGANPLTVTTLPDTFGATGCVQIRETVPGGFQGFQQAFTFKLNVPYIIHARLRVPTGVTASAATLYFGTATPGSVVLATQAQLAAQTPDTWVWYSVVVVFTANTSNVFSIINTGAGGTGTGFDVAAPMLELAAGQSNLNPSEYVSSGKDKLNYLLYTEQLNQSAWTRNNVTVTEAAAGAGDFRDSLCRIAEQATSGQFYVTQTATGLGTGTACSVKFQAYLGERTQLVFSISDNVANGNFATVDLTTGAISGLTSFGSGLAGASFAAYPRPNGVWEIEFLCTTSSSGALLAQVLLSLGSSTTTYSGDASKGLYAGRFQICKTAVSVAGQYYSVGSAYLYPNGSGVDGCQFFSYPNGNARNPTTGVVTAGTGAGPLRWLQLAGLSANAVSTPNQAAFNFSGPIDIRAKVAPDVWRHATNQQFLIGVSNTNAASDISYKLEITNNATGNFLNLQLNIGGSAVNHFSTVAADSVFLSRQRVTVRATCADSGANRVVTFYYSYDDGNTWTQLGNTVTVAGNTSGIVQKPSSPMRVGYAGSSTSSFIGKIYWAEVRNGVNGTVVARFDPTADASPTTALYFDGKTGNVSVPDSGSLKFGNGAFSIALWCNADDINAYTGGNFPAIIEKGTGDFTAAPSTQAGWYLGDGSGSFNNYVFRMGDGTGYDTITLGALKGKGWIHLFVTVDSMTIASPKITYYLNGVQQAQVNRTKSSTDTTVALSMGYWRASNRFWAGMLADVRLYNISVDAGTVASTYYSVLRGNETGLVSLWKFDDTVGITALDTCWTANNGTHAGGPRRRQSEYLPIFSSSSPSAEQWTLAYTYAQGAYLKEAFTAAKLHKYKKEQAQTNLLSTTDISAWTVIGTATLTANAGLAPDGTPTATLVSDANAAAISGASKATTVANDSAQYVNSVLVLKDTTTSRFVGIGIQLSGGTTTVQAQIHLNTQTGGWALDSGVASQSGTVYVNDLGTHWQVELLVTNNSTGNVTATAFLYSAIATTIGTQSVAVQGSAYFCWPMLVQVATTRTFRVGSFIPTAGASVSRPEDVLAWPQATINNAIGSVYAEFELDDPANNGNPYRVIGDAQGSGSGTPISVDHFGIEAWDNTSSINSGATIGCYNVVHAAARWGGVTKQTFNAGVGGTIGSFDGSLDIVLLGIGVGGGFGLQGHIGNVEIYDGQFSQVAMAQFPTSYAVTWVTLDNYNDLQLSFSANPARCTGDFLSNTVFGARKTMDWYSVGVCADFDDQFVGTGVAAEARARMALLLDNKQTVRDWVNALRAYVPCWVTDNGDSTVLVPDAPRPVDHVFTAKDLDSEMLPKFTKRGKMDVPNVVQVGYTVTDVKPWATSYREAVFGSPLIRVISKVEMPGIKRPTQAKRWAQTLLNHYTAEDLGLEVYIFDYGLRVMLGDVVQISDGITLTNALFRVLKVNDRKNGRWHLVLREYRTDAFDGTVTTVSPSNGTGMPDPRVVPSPIGPLTIAEDVFPENNLVPDYLGRGLIYQERFDVSWTEPTHPYPLQYRVEVYDGAVKVREDMVLHPPYTTPIVQQAENYTINVYARNSLGYESPPLTGSKVAAGKTIKPRQVPAITRFFSINGEIFLNWNPAIDLDIIRYELRYSATAINTVADWNNATFIDRVDTLTFRYKGLPLGTWYIAIKALDSMGQYSALDAVTGLANDVPAQVQLTITSDSDSFLSNHTFTNPLLLGSELVPNGDFASSTGWSLGTGATISGGTLNATAVAANSRIASTTVTPGIIGSHLYKVVFTVTAISSGAVKLILGGGGAAGGLSVTPQVTAPGTYTFYVQASQNLVDQFIYVWSDGASACTATIDNLSVKESNNLVQLPAIEGVWLPRWATGFDIDTFNTSEPSPFNSGANPVVSYHTNGPSCFLGESWDLSFAATGDLTLNTNCTALSGSFSSFIETSSDGSTWQRNAGIAFKGTFRFIRPVILATAGTMYFSAPPNIAFVASTKTETGTVTPSANPTLVKLVNKYAASQGLTATVLNNSSGNISANPDRLLLYPQSGLMCTWTCTTSTGDSYANFNVFGSTRTILTDDFLEYDVWIDANNPTPANNGAGAGSYSGMIAIHDSTASTYPALTDTITGQNVRTGSSALDARGQWVSRRCALSAMAGHVADQILIGGDTDNAGAYKVLYRNVRFTNGSGTDRQAIWPPTLGGNIQTEPAANTIVFQNQTVNLMCGPANTFNLWEFNTSNVLPSPVKDISWTFKGY